MLLINVQAVGPVLDPDVPGVGERLRHRDRSFRLVFRNAFTDFQQIAVTLKNNPGAGHFPGTIDGISLPHPDFRNARSLRCDIQPDVRLAEFHQRVDSAQLQRVIGPLGSGIPRAEGQRIVYPAAKGFLQRHGLALCKIKQFKPVGRGQFRNAELIDHQRSAPGIDSGTAIRRHGCRERGICENPPVIIDN